MYCIPPAKKKLKATHSAGANSYSTKTNHAITDENSFSSTPTPPPPQSLKTDDLLDSVMSSSVEPPLSTSTSKSNTQILGSLQQIRKKKALLTNQEDNLLSQLTLISTTCSTPSMDLTPLSSDSAEDKPAPDARDTDFPPREPHNDCFQLRESYGRVVKYTNKMFRVYKCAYEEDLKDVNFETEEILFECTYSRIWTGGVYEGDGGCGEAAFVEAVEKNCYYAVAGDTTEEVQTLSPVLAALYGVCSGGHPGTWYYVTVDFVGDVLEKTTHARIPAFERKYNLSLRDTATLVDHYLTAFGGYTFGHHNRSFGYHVRPSFANLFESLGLALCRCTWCTNTGHRATAFGGPVIGVKP